MEQCPSGWVKEIYLNHKSCDTAVNSSPGVSLDIKMALHGKIISAHWPLDSQNYISRVGNNTGNRNTVQKSVSAVTLMNHLKSLKYAN